MISPSRLRFLNKGSYFVINEDSMGFLKKLLAILYMSYCVSVTSVSTSSLLFSDITSLFSSITVEGQVVSRR